VAEEQLGSIDIPDSDRYCISTRYVTWENTTSVGLILNP
jgi:hypothetical protein